MTLQGLDHLDRYICYALQQGGHETTSGEIAARMGVSDSTVRKRIDRLEQQGVITGYRAEIDYERAGYQLLLQIVCTAPVSERERLAAAARDVPGVVSVRELATGTDNLLVGVVAVDNDDHTRIARDLSELGLAIADEQLVRSEAFVPYQGFVETPAE